MSTDKGQKELGRYWEGSLDAPAGRYYNAIEAAKYLGISRALFYARYWRGLPKFSVAGFKQLYRQEDLDKIKRFREQGKK